MKQIALPLDELRPGASSSLIISESNSLVAFELANAANWHNRCAILCGPTRSGKTLLAKYFSAQAGGEIIDDADGVGEEVIFNAWNRAQESNKPLLLVSRFAPSDWHIELADLRSRLSSALLLNIPPPDDELISHLIQKHLAERGTSIGVETLAYVTKRIERSYSELEKFARQANAAALEDNSPINMALVRKLLG
jgi:hypothetical protein